MYGVFCADRISFFPLQKVNKAELEPFYDGLMYSGILSIKPF